MKRKKEHKGSGFITRNRALQILGEKRFLSCSKVLTAWNTVIEEQRTSHKINPLSVRKNPVIKYPESEILKIAKDKTWFLVYDPGFSLITIRAILGWDRNFQPRQMEGNDWWFLPEGIWKWAESKDKPAYHLLKTDCLFTNMKWQQQEKQISKSKEIYRPSSRLIISARISYFLLRRQYFSQDYWYWGPEVSEDGQNHKVACISKVGPEGFALCNWSCGLPYGEKDKGNKTIGVFVAKKHILPNS